MKNKLNKAVLAVLTVAAATVASASAEISTTELTSAISSGVTAAEALVGAGLAITAVFVIIKVIKKGASKIG